MIEVTEKKETMRGIEKETMRGIETIREIEIETMIDIGIIADSAILVLEVIAMRGDLLYWSVIG